MQKEIRLLPINDVEELERLVTFSHVGAEGERKRLRAGGRSFETAGFGQRLARLGVNDSVDPRFARSKLSQRYGCAIVGVFSQSHRWSRGELSWRRVVS